MPQNGEKATNGLQDEPKRKSRVWSMTNGLYLPTVRGSKLGFGNKILFDYDLVKERLNAHFFDSVE
jgi:hypothetical protein